MRGTTPTDLPAGPLPWGVLRRLIPLLAGNWPRIGLALACLLAAKGALLTIPFLLKHLVDSLDLAAGAGMAAGLLFGLVLAYGAARFANVFFGELRDTLFGRVTERAMRRIGLLAFRHVHSLELDYHLNRRTGGLARDIERGTTGISFLLRFFVFNIAPTLFEIVMVAGILLFNYGGGYASIVVASVVAYALFSFRATEWRTRFVRAVNEADSSSNTRAVDSLLNHETVKYFTNEGFEADRYDESLAEWESARRSNRLSLFALNAGQALIIALSQTAMIGLAAWQVSGGLLSIGDFVLINQFMLQLFMPLGFLGFVYREIKSSLANIENLFSLLDREPMIRDAPAARPLAVGGGEVVFDAVSFHYPNGRPILDGVSFRVPAGKKVALVGASGAGKSTLVKLLFRFYDPAAGAVRIDGQDLREVTQESLRRAVGIVPQDTVLFNDSLRENIRYGRPGASDEEVQAALARAHLEAFVAGLPEGMDTTVGERGLKLSGGEKQRVAIARALLKDAPILVFDEATSSLDSRSEAAVLDALKALARSHTTLVIAHRLSTVIDADELVVLSEGRVVERGTHDDLLARNGYYSHLWLAQQRERTTA
ncbi:ABCB family ABC transporter ATP-binding protein/permease [Pseudohaliea rubra]|uniref:ABCB family ABC transporter ATP-binding protein/permease n=1 Tax=Pseudohaliea rubra TaxID=475795 RepID=UPI000557B9E9|nr:ABC transporter ATP-binding protein/permease [Pseudohaliea rubra]